MICIENLNYIIKNGPVMSGFSMDIKPKEKCLISGPSGSGKTCLFRLLLGFDLPDSGRLNIAGHDVCKQHIRDIRKNVFYLSQDVDLPDETGNILISRILRLNSDQKPASDLLPDFLDLLLLTPAHLDKPVSILSGGERQRLGLLIGFLLNRPVWLLDEPTSALDDAMKQVVSDHIMTLDKTVLIISHDPVWKNQLDIITVNWS